MGSHAAAATTVGTLSALSVLVVDDQMESLERIVDVLQGAGAVGDAHDPAASFGGFFIKPVDLDALVDSLARIRRRG
jgi:hypothetical protein